MTNPNTPYLRDPSKQEHLLEQTVTRLGRAVENEIVIVSKRASREHAHIRRDGRRTFLDDLGSTNGTFLNGERVLGSVQLRDGDQIAVGEVTFTFHDPDTTTRETPFPEDCSLESAYDPVIPQRVFATGVSLSKSRQGLLEG
jgi:pSer/pThr/pTyr-binding forkhead associated (FHA) protein